MTKNQKIKRLENAVHELANDLGYSMDFNDFEEKVHLNFQCKGWNPPIRGWQDPKIQTLLKHLRIVDICKKEQLLEEYEVILIPKKRRKNATK